jgi:phytoene/squalene synthetase
VEQYAKASYAASKLITNSYSTSFGMSIRLFEKSLRPHIYAIYGFVRIADEIVDTYNGTDQRDLLDNLELEAQDAIDTGYSTNPIVHAFAITVRMFNISDELIAPFFDSMRIDLSPQIFDQKLYETYIYGSAEVVGLMCLKVFLDDEAKYYTLTQSAGKLGAAYQKVNFLRDIAADSKGLGRWYFPIGSATTFDETTKQAIIDDIQADFTAARLGIEQLPEGSRHAVSLSYSYYSQLLEKIQQTPAQELIQTRIRINNLSKSGLFLRAAAKKVRRA